MVTTSRSPSPDSDTDVFSLAIIPDRENKQAGTTNTDFDGLLNSPLLLHEDLKNGCGGQLWPAGMTLSRYMLKYHHDLSSKTIIEIGAGGGLVGLAVAKGCQTSPERKLCITDQIPMLSLMEKNIDLNALTTRTESHVYDWGEPLPGQIAKSLGTTQPDIVLAADCVYFEPAFPLLLSTLKDLIGENTICYFCFKKRRKADMRFIKDMMKTFAVEQIEYDNKAADQRQGIWLYSLRAKSR